MLTIRPAESADAEPLTTLMHASSAYTGAYARILENYAITPAQLEKDVFYVALLDGAISGFYSLTLSGEPELDLLFVADSAQGTGLGKTLFQHMANQAKRRGLSAVKIVSHPPSVGFYQRMGATITGTKPPTAKVTWERPILTLPI